MIGESKKQLSKEVDNNKTRSLRYVLITPARNEVDFIELTIKSVVRQIIRPSRWVIVSDGSTDGTDDLVKKYSAEHEWIALVRMPEREERHFAGKAYALNAGYAKVKDMQFDFIGCLDADISFDAEYFDFLLNKFADDNKLGIGGTPFREGTVQYDYRFSRKEHVSGACQLFRRECFESVGGFVPLKGGAVDLTAVVTARMKGWKTETFNDKFCIHHRRMGTAKNHILIATFKSGYGDYQIGVHPIWQLFRSIYQMSRKPIIIGGGLLLVGYMWAILTRAHRPISKELIDFRGKEQMGWLNEYLRKFLRLH